MQAARVILDFPAPGRNHERLEPGAPRRVITADRLSDVRPALREAERAAAAGAWIAGFVGYEAAPAFDSALRTRPHEGPVPLVWFGVFDPPAPTRAPAHGHVVENPLAWTADVTRAEYDTAIASIRNRIAAGDVYQVNHTVRFRAHSDLAPAALYDALVTARQGRYHALIETPHWAIVSASPELFIDVRDGVITTRPMKGTARRGRWPAEDDDAAQRLARSDKDRAENLMIVDLLRNDFGRIARFGSVDVSGMFAVETYPTLHQMTSTITARLRDGVTIDDIFAAAFPCGSVTGAPKVAAMQQIAALEPSPRGPYCGAIGVMRPDGTATFNVAIRTLVIDRAAHAAVYGAGGGITWDSAPDAEYDEVHAKTALLAGPETQEFDLLETLRLENGVLHRLDLHLDRLSASARYWDFSEEVPRQAAATLRRVAAESPAGTWRVRMTVSRDAHVSTALVRLDHTAGDAPGPCADTVTGGPRVGAAPTPRPDATHSIAIATAPVHSSDRLLYHKTTARALYDEHRAAHPHAFDVLLHNEHGCITEFTIGNVICEIDGELLTPPRDAGLLAGTFRQQLLTAGIVREENIRLVDLPRVTRMWLVNSVREWVPVQPDAQQMRKGQSR